MGRKGYHWIDLDERNEGLQKSDEGLQSTNFDNFSPNVKRNGHASAGSAWHVPRLVRMGQEVVRWPTICLESRPMHRISVSEP